jgi:hypothetical protein
MSVVAQRARIARVRRLQHDLAAAAAAKANGHVQTLELNSRRLKQIREGLSAEPGLTCGAALASRGELAQRLESARNGLGRTIEGARAAARLREAERLGARRDQEGAEKLERRAAQAAASEADERAAASFRPRRTNRNGGTGE